MGQPISVTNASSHLYVYVHTHTFIGKLHFFKLKLKGE